MRYAPTTNLSKVVHASWLVGQGYKAKMDLYEASVSDLSQALLQSTKAYAYSKGRYHGLGPSASRLAKKVKAQGSLHPRTID